LGYYTDEINGKYENATIKAVLEFQKNYSVIGSDTDYGAGFFGPKTKKALEQAVAKKESKLEFGKILAKTEFKTTNMIVAFEEYKVQSKTKIFASVPKKEKQIISKNLKKGDQGVIVKELQKMLKEEGYLQISQETEFFGSLTEKALIQYQIDKGIIPSKNNAGAGIVGPMTRNSLNAFIDTGFIGV
jgi:peptidoglycan hydrolase-like protein with peptidoglycan-binding domain